MEIWYYFFSVPQFHYVSIRVAKIVGTWDFYFWWQHLLFLIYLSELSFSFSLGESSLKLVSFVYLVKESAPSFTIYFPVVSVSIVSISAPSWVVFFFLLTFDVLCFSCFCFPWDVMLGPLRPFCFLLYTSLWERPSLHPHTALCYLSIFICLEVFFNFCFDFSDNPLVVVQKKAV